MTSDNISSTMIIINFQHNHFLPQTCRSCPIGSWINSKRISSRQDLCSGMCLFNQIERQADHKRQWNIYKSVEDRFFQWPTSYIDYSILFHVNSLVNQRRVSHDLFNTVVSFNMRNYVAIDSIFFFWLFIVFIASIQQKLSSDLMHKAAVVAKSCIAMFTCVIDCHALFSWKSINDLRLHHSIEQLLEKYQPLTITGHDRCFLIVVHCTCTTDRLNYCVLMCIQAYI